MKTVVFFCLCIFFFICPTQQQSYASSTYKAGVVEYAPHNGTIEEITANNLQNYIDIINQVENESLDILVFPEATLNRDWAGTTPPEAAIYVPSETENAIPCDSSNYSEILKKISCAAALSKMYIVINVAEIAICNTTAFKNCTDDEKFLFNTNVVFDRDGKVISRYRKIHLFGESGFSESDDKKLGIFETDFGVKFGHFICFDLMFQEPTMQLIDLGIKNIIFPTMWFSELSALTAVEIQQSFAYTHNVNFLAAGANNPHIGSTGSGIYSGKSGAFKSVMRGVKFTDILIADVPKIPDSDFNFNAVEKNIIREPMEMDQLYLKAQNMTIYKSGIIDMNKEHQTINLISNDVKCDFEVSLNKDFLSNATGSNHYFYRAVIFNGVRAFDYKTGGVIECCIVACTSDNDINTCAHRFPSYLDVKAITEFTNIKINAKVPKPKYNDTVRAYNIAYYPVTLLTSIYPLQNSEFDYTTKSSDDAGSTLIEMSINSPHSEFLTFGIFGRNFDKDMQPVSGSANLTNCFTFLIIGLLITLRVVNISITSP